MCSIPTRQEAANFLRTLSVRASHPQVVRVIPIRVHGVIVGFAHNLPALSVVPRHLDRGHRFLVSGRENK